MTDLNPMDPKPKRTRKAPVKKKPEPKGRKTLIAAVLAAVLAAADLYVAVRYPGNGPACAALKNIF